MELNNETFPFWLLSDPTLVIVLNLTRGIVKFVLITCHLTSVVVELPRSIFLSRFPKIIFFYFAVKVIVVSPWLAWPNEMFKRKISRKEIDNKCFNCFIYVDFGLMEVSVHDR